MVRVCLLIALAACACTQLHAAETGQQQPQAQQPQPDAQDETETVKEIMGSLPQVVTDILWNQLHNESSDYFNGFVALILGWICVYQAETVYNYIFVVIVFLGTHLIATNQITEQDINLKTFEVMEISALAAYIALKSSRGINVLLAASIGYGVAKYCEDMWFSARGVTESDMPKSWIVSWYALSVLVFIRIFNSKYQLQLWALVCTYVGGAFLASAIMYFSTLYAIGCCNEQLQETWWANPKAGSYVDFLLLLYTKNPPDVGLFSGEMWRPWPTVAPEGVNGFYGCLLWAWFFFTGAWGQIKALRASVRAEKEGVLQEPLLPQ